MKAIVAVLASMMVVAQAAQVTPMEKVVGLLKGLSEKVAAEGKEEAANYDKYACFCKEQADGKLYAIEKSEALIKKQTAQIDKLDGEINKLNGDIGTLSKEIKKQEGIIESKTNTRNDEHDEYMKDAADYLGAIDACEAAIAALKDSKGSLSADAKSTLALVQKKTAKLNIKGAPKFQYQSNHIIELLEKLLDKTKVQKNELDQFEFDLKAVYDEEMVEANNALRFAEKEKAEKSALSEKKNEAMTTLKQERSEEDTDMDSDQAFLDTLTSKCEAASTLFDQRSKSRADEMTALSDATAELTSEGGASDRYKKEGKLNGFLQKKMSFLQTRSRSHRHPGSKLAAIQQAQVLIADAADRTKSSVLSSMALRMKVSEDHFVKVRGLIKDLIAKLKKDAKEEQAQKSFCDKNMKNALTQRDNAQASLESANAKHAQLTAEKEDLESTKQNLIEQIADLKKALLEATELRTQQSLENTWAINNATAGSNSVKRAVGILEQYYFLQYKPALSDRDGNTVDDLATYAPTETYHGASAESKGILGILEVIQSDFDRTVKKTSDEEKQQSDDFDDLEKDMNGDIDKKTAFLKTTKKRLVTNADDLVDEEDEQQDQSGVLDDAKDQLAKLKPICVEGEETYAERVEARNKEIAALKDALAILEDWQS